MNTKFIMTLSAVVLGLTGVAMTFVPDSVANELMQNNSTMTPLLIQIMGGLYFGFAMLNWMVKGGLIGGVYNRPIAVANFTHFMISGIAILKALFSNAEVSYLWWCVGILYSILGISFGLILFRHPLRTIES